MDFKVEQIKCKINEGRQFDQNLILYIYDLVLAKKHLRELWELLSRKKKMGLTINLEKNKFLLGDQICGSFSI